MARCRITVLKRMLNADLARRHVREPVSRCPAFEEGQEFIVADDLQKPTGFCDWAWNDIHTIVVTLARGGDFATGLFDGWMKNKATMIACCTDGVRPVAFEVTRIEE